MKLKNQLILFVLGLVCLLPITNVDAKSALDVINGNNKNKETIECGYTSSPINGNSSLGNVNVKVLVKNGIINYEFSDGYVLWEDNEKLSSDLFTNNSCPALEVTCGTCGYIDEYCEQDAAKICKLKRVVIQNNAPEEDDGTVGFKNNIDEKYVICNGAEIPYGVPVIVSRIVNLIKVAIPVILIVLGMIDFLKAVISNDEKNMKASSSSFVRRGIAAFIIFFVFSIVQFVFSLVDEGAFGCVNCILNEECGPVYSLNTGESDADEEVKVETVDDYINDSGTFNFSAVPGEYVGNTISLNENLQGKYICSMANNRVSKVTKCTSKMFGGYNCEINTKHFTLCEDLCDKIPSQVTCINH